MHCVKEALYVKKEGHTSSFGMQCALDVMGEGKTGIEGAQKCLGPELCGGHESMFVNVV